MEIKSGQEFFSYAAEICGLEAAKKDAEERGKKYGFEAGWRAGVREAHDVAKKCHGASECYGTCARYIEEELIKGEGEPDAV